MEIVEVKIIRTAMAPTARCSVRSKHLLRLEAFRQHPMILPALHQLVFSPIRMQLRSSRLSNSMLASLVSTRHRMPSRLPHNLSFSFSWQKSVGPTNAYTFNLTNGETSHLTLIPYVAKACGSTTVF
jgi:hypothetical protein